MAKKKTHKLALNDEYNFHLIGLASHENDYRLSWSINAKLHFNFIQTQPHQVIPKNATEPIHFNVFEHEDEDNFVRYLLISNHNESGFLIPEFKNIDYFIEIQGEMSENELLSLKQKLNAIDIVQTSVIIDIQSVKSKKNLVLG